MKKPNSEIIEKYFAGSASEKEAAIILNWFETREGQNYLANRFEKDVIQREKHQKHSNTTANAHNTLHSIKYSISKKESLHVNRISRLQRRTSHWLVAASIILLLAITSVLNIYDLSGNDSGFQVFLTGGSEHKIFKLNDGTTVRLSENSRLEIPSGFNTESRSVKLEGQAFFEVEYNQNAEFRVHSSRTTIEVLGTAFNVSTLSRSNNVMVVVAEGKVSLEADAEPKKNAEILTANTVGNLDLSTGEIQIEKADIHNYLSWIHGNIKFDSTPFLNVVKQLERIYDISNHIENEELLELRLTANFSRGPIENVLDIISEGLGIDYDYRDETVNWSIKQ